MTLVKNIFYAFNKKIIFEIDKKFKIVLLIIFSSFLLLSFNIINVIDNVNINKKIKCVNFNHNIYNPMKILSTILNTFMI